MYLKYGSQWSKLSKFFKNRSANSLKNRWNYFVLKKLDKQTKSKVDELKAEKNEHKSENSSDKNSPVDSSKSVCNLESQLFSTNNDQKQQVDSNNINVLDFQFNPHLFDSIHTRENIFIQDLDTNMPEMLEFDFCF